MQGVDKDDFLWDNDKHVIHKLSSEPSRIWRDMYEWIDVRFYETIINTGEIIDTMWRTLGVGEI